MDKVGYQLEKYRLVALLGHGSFAEVYLGQHIQIHNLYAAIKILNTRLSESYQEGFRREAEIIAELRHPNIIRIVDYGIDTNDNSPYLSMDYARQGTVRKRHPKGNTVPLETLLPYVKQIASALQYAHDRNLIHRDLKPENLLVGENDEIVVSDFGIATVVHATSTLETSTYSGTAVYSAPEQILGKPRVQSDQYALGVILYEWLTGDPPFHGSFPELCAQHLYAFPQPLHEKVRGIPREVEEVVMTALAKDPHQRFQRIQAFAKALEQAYALSSYPTLLAEKPVPGQPTPTEFRPIQKPEQVPLQGEIVSIPPQKSAVETPLRIHEETNEKHQEPVSSQGTPNEGKPEQVAAQKEVVSESQQSMVEIAPPMHEERARQAEEERHRLAEEAERTRKIEEERQQRIEEEQVRQAKMEQVRQAEKERRHLAEEAVQPAKVEEHTPSTQPPQRQASEPVSSYQRNPPNGAALPSSSPLSPPLPLVKRNLNLRLTVPILLFLTVLIGGSISFFIISTSTPNGGHTNTSISTGSGTIEVATDLPVSSKDSSNGKPAEDGAHMAIDEANASNAIPGYKLVFVPKDDVGSSGAHDPAIGAQNVTALISDALVAGIVGPFNSSVAQSEMPIANQAPIALISPSNTNQCLTQTNAVIGCSGANNLVPTLRPTGKVTYFRIATTDDHQGPTNADYLYKTQNYKTAYVVDDAETYGIGIANTFSSEWTKLGGTVLGRSSEPGTTTSFVSLLTQIASKKPDVIYFGGTDATGGTLIRQQMQQVPGLENTPFAGGDGIVTADFATTIGLTGGPVYGTIASADVTKNPAASSFIQNYTATYGALGAYSATGYDAMKILILAIKTAIASGVKVPQNSSDAASAKVFRQAVINAIQATNYTGLTGHHTFDANGDTTYHAITIQQLASVDGKPGWKVLESLIVK